MSDRYYLVIVSLLCTIAANVTDGWTSVVYSLGAIVFCVLWFVDGYFDRAEKKARR